MGHMMAVFILKSVYIEKCLHMIKMTAELSGRVVTWRAASSEMTVGGSCR